MRGVLRATEAVSAANATSFFAGLPSSMKGADGFVIVMQRINDSPKRLEEISVPQKSIWRLWGVSVMFAGSRWNWVLSSAAP